MSYQERMPFTDVVAKSKVLVSGAVDVMITRAPWQPGAGKYYTLRKVQIANVGAFETSVVSLWDQDLSSATPATRGNASTGALLTLNTVGGASGYGYNVIAGLNECPRIRFEAGVCAQATNENTSIILELELN